MLTAGAGEESAPAGGRTVATAADGTRRWAAGRYTAGLVLLCAATLFLLFRQIEGTMPYPYHADEGFISGPAYNILVKGQLHPHRFNYPSLPAYIAAASMAVGFVRGATHLELRDVNQIGRVTYPSYETPRVMKTARQAFALLAVVCLATTGLSAFHASQRPATMVLAPLLLIASPLYFRHSWLYLNVDIVGTSFVMLAVAACLAGSIRPSIRRSAILPGVFAGLAAGSKYTFAIVVLPVVLSIGLHYPRARAVAACGAAVGAMIAAFLAAVPYSLIDIPGFLNGIGYEAFHYASGHAGSAGEPGWPQLLFYSRHFLGEFGYVACALAVLGLGRLAVIDWRRAAVLAIFPAALLWLLISQRVHFTRNALAIHPFVAMGAAYGLLTLHGWIVQAAARRGWARATIPVPALAAVILVIATVPVWHLASHLKVRRDSRNLAAQWVDQHLPLNWAIVVPKELGFDTRGLDARGRHIKVVDLLWARDRPGLDALLDDVPSPAVLMVPRWGADRRSPGQKAADALNAASQGRRIVKSFGSNDVLVNYSSTTAWGDPAFAIAIVK